MTDPAEIAAKLTPAQIKVLRSFGGKALIHWSSAGNDNSAINDNLDLGLAIWVAPVNALKITPLGRAVLAELDAAK